MICGPPNGSNRKGDGRILILFHRTELPSPRRAMGEATPGKTTRRVARHSMRAPGADRSSQNARPSWTAANFAAFAKPHGCLALAALDAVAGAPAGTGRALGKLGSFGPVEAREREDSVRKWDGVRLVSGDLGWSTAGKDRRRYRVPGVRKWNWVRLVRFVLRANQAPGVHGAIENKQLLGSFGSGVGEAAAGGAAPLSSLNPVWTCVVRLVMRSRGNPPSFRVARGGHGV